MIKRLLFVLVIVSLFFSSVIFADAVTKNISEADDWTTVIVPNPVTSTTGRKSGFLNISGSGTWVLTATLQRRYIGEVTWLDVKTWTANFERALIDREPNVDYRLGVKAGEYTSGTLVARLATE